MYYLPRDESGLYFHIITPGEFLLKYHEALEKRLAGDMRGHFLPEGYIIKSTKISCRLIMYNNEQGLDLPGEQP
jgi:hypothetical protein